MKKISIAIIDKDPTSNEVVKQYIEDSKKVSNISQFIDLKEGYDFVFNKKPKVILIDMAFGEESVLNVVNKIYQNDSECKIIITGTHFSASSIIKARKTGAKETLKKPIIKKEIDSLINKFANQINFESTEENAKVISIFSSKGGIGKTTIATNIALEIANITKEKTVIVDFNSQFGDVCTFLNTEPKFDLEYILRNQDKLDKDFLLTNLPKYKKTSLYVLADLFNLDDNQEISLVDVQNIIDALKATFSYIIIDMNTNLDFKATKIFDNSDDILFPIIANMPNLRNCQRSLNFLKKMGYYDSTVKIILNRYLKQDEIKSENIETILNKKIFAKLSNDYFNNMTAINRGLAVSEVDNNSPFSKDIQNLAYKLAEKEV